MNQRKRVSRRAKGALSIAAAAGAAVLAGRGASAAPATWNAAPTDGNWVTIAGENNWSTGDGTFPGSVGATNSADVATFSGTSSITSIAINQAGLNVAGLTFDGSTVSSYTIGANGGNALSLSAGGTTQILSTVTSGAHTEIIAAPVSLNGAYTFANNAGTSSTSVLQLTGGVSGGVTNAVTMTLGGSNTGTNNMISGVIANGSSSALSISKTGGGNWVLNNTANTFTGNVSVSGGSLRANNAGSLGGATSVTVTGGELALMSNTVVNGVTATITGNGTDNMGALKSLASGTTQWNGPVVLGADQARIGTSNNNGVFVINGVISSGTNAWGPAIRLPNGQTNAAVVFTAPNTYKGLTSVVVGTLRLGAEGTLPTTTVVNFGNNSIQGSAFLDLNGTSPTVAGIQTVAGANIPTSIFNNSATHSLLTVSNSTNLTFGAAASNVVTIAGNMSLTKAGSGTLTLAGATNSAYTYTGTTTIAQGTLALAQNNLLPDAAPITLSGGTFNTGGATNGFSDTTGAMTLASSSSIDLGGNGTAAASILHFANSAATAWSGTLTIANWGGSTNGGGVDQVYFGSDATGLTAQQLSEITFTGFSPGAAILSNGEVVPNVPEPVGLGVLSVGAGALLRRRKRRTQG